MCTHWTPSEADRRMRDIIDAAIARSVTEPKRTELIDALWPWGRWAECTIGVGNDT